MVVRPSLLARCIPQTFLSNAACKASCNTIMLLIPCERSPQLAPRTYTVTFKFPAASFSIAVRPTALESFSRALGNLSPRSTTINLASPTALEIRFASSFIKGVPVFATILRASLTVVTLLNSPLIVSTCRFLPSASFLPRLLALLRRVCVRLSAAA